jgi:DNA-directed RNA polymerase specialized sigma24 family protein
LPISSPDAILLRIAVNKHILYCRRQALSNESYLPS